MTKTKATLLFLLVLLAVISTSCVTIDTSDPQEDIGEVGETISEAWGTPNVWSEALRDVITDN